MENIVKLTILSKEFEILNDKKIRCILTVRPKVDLKNDNIVNAFERHNVSWKDKSVFVGTAVCSSEDEFSVEKGRQIAFSSAKRKAYRKFLNVFADALRMCERQHEELIEDTKK